jgi:hypothetical protein
VNTPSGLDICPLLLLSLGSLVNVIPALIFVFCLEKKGPGGEMDDRSI